MKQRVVVIEFESVGQAVAAHDAARPGSALICRVAP
jgi:hypothetical protein